MAHVDYFLKIPGVEGEANGYIQVLGWSWGLADGNPGGVNRSGKVSVQDLSFVHDVDVASPKILQASCEGKRFKQAMLWGQDEQESTVMKLLLSDVFISGVEAQSSAADSVPVEEVSLNFSKIEYTMIGADGAAVVGFCDGSV